MVIRSFSYVDYIVFGSSLLISVLIGVYYSRSGGRQRSVEEYLMGNRQITCLPVALSLLVTFQSGISLLGLPVEIYYYGTQIYMGVCGLVIAYVIVAFFIVPVLYPLQLTSVYEYLEMRFQSRGVRLVGCILGLLFTVTYMAVCLFLPGLALESVTGFPKWVSVVLVAVVVVVYTMMGGIKAVIWTDVFQFVVMVAGILTLLIKGCSKVGGIQMAWKISNSEERIQFFNIDTDPTTRQTLWAVTIGTITPWIGNALSQSGIQRICATGSIQEARKAVLFNLPAALLLETMMACLGLILFAYYVTMQCDPHDSGLIQSPNQLVPYFMMEHLSVVPGLAGLFLACLFSATLSTLSSGLSAISALVWEDFIQPYFKCFSLRQGSMVTKITVPVFGIAIVGLSFLAMNLEGTITQITIGSLSATSGPLVGVYILGMVFPWATAKAAVVSGSLSFCLCLTMTVGANLYPTSSKTLPSIPTTGCHSNNTELTSIHIMNMTNNYLEENTSLNEVFSFPTQKSIAQYSTTTPLTTSFTTPISISDYDSIKPGVMWLFRVSFLWYHMTGVLCTLIVGILVTIVTGGMSDVPCEERFLFVFVRKMECYRRQLRMQAPLTSYSEFRASFRGKYSNQIQTSI